MTKMIHACALAALISFGVSQANAAIELQPGMWKTTETGTEDGKPAKPEVEESCMTPQEARDAKNVVAELRKQAQASGGQCQRYDVNESGNTVTFVMRCGMAQQFMMDISGTFNFVSATRYTGTLKSAITLGGKTTTSDKKIDAVRVGDCRK